MFWAVFSYPIRTREYMNAHEFVRIVPLRILGIREILFISVYFLYEGMNRKIEYSNHLEYFH